MKVRNIRPHLESEEEIFEVSFDAIFSNEFCIIISICPTNICYFSHQKLIIAQSRFISPHIQKLYHKHIYFLVESAGAPLAGLGFGLYLFGVVSSYAASTIYHAVPSSEAKVKGIARKFDHAAIFWHIAGSYSPLTLIGMKQGGEPTWAWVIFGIVWLAAVVGTSLSFRKMKKQSYIETACYVLMGLTILIAFKPFYDSCGLPVVLWVVGEGIAYITGAVLYSFKKIPYIHSLFHLFVILGDICHMIATWMVIQMFIL